MSQRVHAILGTDVYNWRVLRRNLLTGSAPSFKLSGSILSNGGFALRETLWNAIPLDRLWRGKDAPNGIKISPYLTTNSTATLNNVNFKFQVDAFRGRENNLERVCTVSGTAGGYKFFKDDEGLSTYGGYTIASGRYADFLNLTEDYNHTIDLEDAASDNGRAMLSLDWEGRGMIAVNMLGTLGAGIGLGFSISGW